MKKGNKERFIKEKVIITSLVIVELLFFWVLFLSPSSIPVLAEIAGNATVSTLLTVGEVDPEILNVTILGTGGIDLTANSTTTVFVEVIARDFNGEDDIINVTSVFFDIIDSTYGGSDDNNNHYTNNSCNINTSYGTTYEINATCEFYVYYYANNATWNATALVTDNTSRTDLGSDLETVNILLAVGLPSSINYGTVNSTEVSSENVTNVTNFGNVRINLTLEGYGASQGDNLSMNCTLGTSNISIGYEKYNLTSSIPGTLSLSDFEANYTNLTSTRVINEFNLNYRQNDTSAYFGDTNSTYWRIYVPAGAAGSCTGNIIFGATIG